MEAIKSLVKKDGVVTTTPCNKLLGAEFVFNTYTGNFSTHIDVSEFKVLHAILEKHHKELNKICNKIAGIILTQNLDMNDYLEEFVSGTSIFKNENLFCGKKYSVLEFIEAHKIIIALIRNEIISAISLEKDLSLNDFMQKLITSHEKMICDLESVAEK